MEYCGWGDLAMKIKRYIKRREYIDERVIWVYLIQILEGLKVNLSFLVILVSLFVVSFSACMHVSLSAISYCVLCLFALARESLLPPDSRTYPPSFPPSLPPSLPPLLQALHERNVLHRDLKPANCFLAEDGSIKIGDMNVSKVMKDGNAKTQIGTPYYMSPEIWARRPYNHATDIWSLGCLIYELCALRPPFLGNNMSELKTAVLGGHFNPVPSVYSQDLGSVIARMLTPAAKERPSAAQALAYPEVHARKCLVKNVLREDELASLSAGMGGMGVEDALMPTIHIGSLRELGFKLPGPSYPTDGPLTPTTPVMLAHDASPVNEKAPLCSAAPSSSHHHQQQQQQQPASISPSNRRAAAPASSSSSSSSPPPSSSSSSSSSSNVIHRRQPSAVPVNLDKDRAVGGGGGERASTPPPLSYDRRRSHDVNPGVVLSRLPLASGASSPTHASGSSSSSSSSGSSHATPVGGVQGESYSRPSSVKSVLQSAQKEAAAAAAAGESPSRRRGSLS